MKTKVVNVITNETTIFINEYNTVENMISYLIAKLNRSSNLCNPSTREQIKKEYCLVEQRSINGKDLFCFCEQFDAIARQPLP